MFLTKEIGASRFSAALAADLWATRAMKVVFETSGVKVAEEDALIAMEPVVPARFITAAWYDFCREFGYDPRAVWFSNGKPEQEGYTVFDIRGRCLVDRNTGSASKHFQEVLVAGIFTVTIRFAPTIKEQVETFLKMFNPGFIRLGKSRSVHGWVKVLGTQSCTVEEAKEREATPAISTAIESPYATVASDLARRFELNKLNLVELRRTLRLVAANSRSPLSAHLKCLYASVKKGIFAIRPRDGGEPFGKVLGDQIRVLPNLIEVAKFFDQVLVVASN